jgi:hypothetical protein
LEERRQYGRSRTREGGPPLAQYRLYFLQGVNRHISYSHEFEAENDERAIRIAEGWREGRGAELWSGSRKLKSWEADG